MEQRLSLVTLGVADLARSRRFYERMGWAASGTSVDGVVCFFQAGGMALALYGRAAQAADAGIEPAEGGGFEGIALAQNVRDKEAVDAILGEAASAGGRILRPGGPAEWGGYVGYFADPDGHLWEIAWNPHFAILADGSLKLPR